MQPQCSTAVFVHERLRSEKQHPTSTSNHPQKTNNSHSNQVLSLPSPTRPLGGTNSHLLRGNLAPRLTVDRDLVNSHGLVLVLWGRVWPHSCRKRGQEIVSLSTSGKMNLQEPSHSHGLALECYWEYANKTRFPLTFLEGKKKGSCTQIGHFYGAESRQVML